MTDLPIADYFPEASQLIYGCMNMGGGWNSNAITEQDISHAQAVIEASLANKINTFDLADIYTFGKAEETFGKVLQQSPKLRDKMIIQSKIGLKLTPTHAVKQYDLSPEWINQALNASLQRLQIEQLDILFLHRPDPLMDLDDSAAMLEKLHKQGKFKYLAVSNMHAAQIAWLQSALEFPIIANQLEMSLAHADFIEESITTNTQVGSQSGFPRGTLEFCEQQNIQLQAWGSLAQGRYSGKPNEQASDADIATSKLVMQLSNRHSSNASAIVLAWLMKHPLNIQPVIGTTNAKRIAECAQASKVKLSREEWYQLFASARGHDIP